MNCVDDVFEVMKMSSHQWRHRRQSFEMKARQYLEGRKPVPTFNYYQMLDDEIQVGKENAEMVMVVTTFVVNCKFGLHDVGTPHVSRLNVQTV